MRRVGRRNPHTLRVLAGHSGEKYAGEEERQKLTIVVHQGDLIVTHKPRPVVNIFRFPADVGQGSGVHTSYRSQSAMLFIITKPSVVLRLTSSPIQNERH